MSIRIKIAKWLAPELARERDGWEEAARHYSDGHDFYRSLVEKIGGMYGVASQTSDDGSVGDSVLALKVPELVRKTKDLYADLEGANANLWLKLQWANHALKQIKDLRTPKCSHVVKKACDIADAALSHPSIPTQEAE